MAEDWIKVDPAAGTGNSQVKVTVDEHTGREARSAELTLRARDSGGGENAPKDVVIPVTQNAADPFITLDQTTFYVESGEGGEENKYHTFTLNFSGRANVAGINISIYDLYSMLVNVKVDALPDDAGTLQAYDFTGTFGVYHNLTTEQRKATITLKDPDTGISAVITIIQAGQTEESDE